VRVTNLANGRRVKVVVDDRGPFVRGRVIDLSVATARRLGMVRDGVVPVRLEVVRWAAEPAVRGTTRAARHDGREFGDLSGPRDGPWRTALLR
jgi:rare lipoprotein A